MEKEFATYEQALALKELGFDESTYTWRQHGNGISGNVEGKRDYYNRKGDVYVALPLYQQTFRWFREKHNLFGHVLSIGERNYEWRIQNIKNLQDRRHFTLADIGGGQIDNTYEEAELECLKKLIDLVKENN